MSYFEKVCPDKKVSTLLVPFGGSGTFIFEFIILIFKFSNNFFDKKFSFDFSLIFKEKSSQFLFKKSIQESENIDLLLNQIIYSDIHEDTKDNFLENFNYFLKCVENNSPIISNALKKVKLDVELKNFLKIEVNEFKSKIVENEVIFMPLNPPYGLRQQSKTNNVDFYEKITDKLNKIGSIIKQSKAILYGFILCPNEEVWGLSINNLHTPYKETFHFTQGGIHIRAAFFIYK